MNLTHRKARPEDVPKIVALLMEDEFGAARESTDSVAGEPYMNAFRQIDGDPNHYLMVVENHHEIVATCQLTMIPSLTFTGSTRMQIEAVRVAEKYRGQKIGHWMIGQALLYARQRNVAIVQLSTNKKRSAARRFYEELGFEASHEGMKLFLGEE